MSRGTRRTAAIAAALVAASIGGTASDLRTGCPSAYAGDAPITVDLNAPARWIAGEWTTETSTTETTSAAAGGAAPVVTSVECTLVRRCAKLRADKRPSALLMYVKSWRATGGAAEDRSLEGAVVLLESDGWTLVRRAAEPSPRAIAWLAGDVVACATWGEAAAAAIVPAHRAAVDDSWKPAPAGAAASVLRHVGHDGDATAVGLQCTLKSAATFAGTLTVRVEFASETASGGAPAVQLTGSVEGVPGEWHRKSATTTTASFDRVTTAEGKSSSARVTVRSSSKCEPSGEFPEGTPGKWLTESGIAKAEKGDAAGAIADFTTATEVEPTYAPAVYRRGLARAAQKDAAGAIEDFTRAIELDPRNAAAWCGRAAAHWASGHTDSAISDYTSAIKLQPAYAPAYNLRGVALAYQTHFDEAIADYTKAIELDPAYAAAYNNRGISRDLRSDAAGALADFVKATEIDPAFVAAWFNRGRGKAALGDFEGAIDDCTKTIDLNPKYAAAWNTRGNCRSEVGDHDGAVADWTKTIELDPRHGQAHFSIARTRFLPGLPSAPVVEEIRKAMDLTKNQDYERLWLWLARARGGEEAEATKELKEYVAKRKSSAADKWYLTVAGLLTGDVLDDEALGESLTSDPKTSAQQLCEAAFYAAMLRILRGDVAKAVELFDRAIATKVTTFIEYTEAHRWRPTILLGATTCAVRAPGGAAAAKKEPALTIVSPDPKGAAAIAGLVHGDVVTKVNGAPPKPGEFEKFLRTAEPGTKVKLEILRKGKRIPAELTLGAARK